MEFRKWPKTKRYENIECFITEKVDGTNALIAIDEEGNIKAGSRNRWLTADHDNMGFHAWVMENKEELLKLGKGYYYGEWIGKGINRNYGLEDRCLLLFERPTNADKLDPELSIYDVPLMGVCSLECLDDLLTHTKTKMGGFSNINGFPNPEGLMVNIPALGKRIKYIFK